MPDTLVKEVTVITSIERVLIVMWRRSELWDGESTMSLVFRLDRSNSLLAYNRIWPLRAVRTRVFTLASFSLHGDPAKR